MKFAIVAAAGRSGRRITEEALRRGHEVTAFVPSVDEYRGAVPEGITVREKTILDLTREDLAPFDAVIDCFGVWREEEGDLHTETLLHLAGCLSGTGVHLLVVGGAGGLFTDGTHTRHFHETPGFPARSARRRRAPMRRLRTPISPRTPISRRTGCICPTRRAPGSTSSRARRSSRTPAPCRPCTSSPTPTLPWR